MSDYTEHLISMAGGDGEPDLDAIQARAEGLDGEFRADVRHAHAITDRHTLLAVVREQQARIDRVEALASRWATLGASHAYYSKRVRHAVRKTP